MNLFDAAKICVVRLGCRLKQQSLLTFLYFMRENIHLSKQLRERLIQAATKTQNKAYAPYSGYRVGASVLGENGRIYTGCNVEIATLSQTTHAERVAINTMVASGEKKLKAICCVTEGKRNVVLPCLECRQVIWEFAGGNKNIIVIGASLTSKRTAETTIGRLTPHVFGPKNLNSDT